MSSSGSDAPHTSGRSLVPLAANGSVLDLRVAFTLEHRVAPALLLIASWAVFTLVGAGVSSFVRDSLLLWWLVLAVNVGTRSWFVTRQRRSFYPLSTSSSSVRAYLFSHIADALLWAGLIGLQAFVHGVDSTAVFAAAAVLLSAFTIGRWPGGWTPVAVSWVASVVVSLFLRSYWDAPLTPLTAGLPFWIIAVWWLGLAQSGLRTAAAAVLVDETSPSTLTSRTRIGWKSAIQAIPTPVIVLRAGRVIDVNLAAQQFIGGDEASIIGSMADEYLQPDPADAFDPINAAAARGALSARVLPAQRTFHDVGAWVARIHVLTPGQADSSVVVSLIRPISEPLNDFADDAKRLANWLSGSQAGQPWYRDARGQVYLPAEFDATWQAPQQHEFPLAAWVVPTERAKADAQWRQCAARGKVFDRVLTLLDQQKRPLRLRVTCLSRPAATTEAGTEGAANSTATTVIEAATKATSQEIADRNADPSRWRPVVGVLMPAPADERAAAPTLEQHVPPGWRRALPVMVWWMDRYGQVARTEGSDPWRWGFHQQTATHEGSDKRALPLWSDVLQLIEPERADMLAALRRALAGKPTFDLLNTRVTQSGARITLRSHLVPFADQLGGAGVLVLDTIASPKYLSEVDRLRRRKRHYKKLVEASNSLIWACDARFHFTYASKRAAREIYGYEASELIGRSLTSLLATGVDQSEANHALASLRLGKSLRQLEMTQQGREGQRLIVAVDAAPLFGSDGAFAGAIGMNADLTVLKQRERRLTEALRIERTVLDSAGQAIAVIKDGLVARCNDAFLKLVHTPPGQLARTPIARFIGADGEWQEIATAADTGRLTDRAAAREVQVHREVGDAWCQLTARSIAPGEYVLVLADIDHIRSREAEALHHAHHDDLTGLPNRRLLAVRGSAALASSSVRNAQCAVFVIDLDGFKQVNDLHGHKVGDLVLREVSERLKRLLRPQDTVARRGGDEFAMLVPDVSGREDIERIATRVLHALEQPVLTAAGVQAQLTASVGIAMAPEHGRELERLLQLADHAMYEAKRRGKNRYAFATVQLTAAVTTLHSAGSGGGARANSALPRVAQPF